MKKFSLTFAIVLLFPIICFAEPSGLEALTITELANGDKKYSVSLKILALMTALTVYHH